jgi:hypothetical protein
MSSPVISTVVVTVAVGTYPRDQVPYFIHQTLHIIVFPSGRKIDVPVTWMRLPPKGGVHSSAAA